MHPCEYLLLISCFIVFFNYIGYAIIAAGVNALRAAFIKPPAKPSAPYYDTVSFVVAAYNEEDVIRQKVENSLQQKYPADKIEFLFVTDGSTDHTMDIIREYPSIQLLHTPGRSGKSKAIDRAVGFAQNNILVFSDANTMLNEEAVMNIVRHYADRKVGGVAGEKKVMGSADDGTVAQEGLYWKYESMLKKIDSDFYSVVGAAGELFSLRRDLYESIGNDVILDDFVLSLNVAKKGYRFKYEPLAYATELPSFSLKDEGKRKVRIAAGGFQAMTMLWPLLLFWKHPRLSFLYISHRVLRWTLTPLSLILVFVSSGVLSFELDRPFYKWFFILQILFYLAIYVYSKLPEKRRKIKLLQIAYYFIFMNVSVVKGFFRYLKGRQPAAWEKAQRSTTKQA